MTKNLTNDNLKKYLDNIDDHMFTLNRLRYNTKENNFEVQKEVAMIHLITQDFLEENLGLINKEDIDRKAYKNSLEKILEYTEEGGQDINRIIGICCDGLYESRE